MRISHSKLELYKQCPKKYYYRHIERLEKDITHSPLLFGSALDTGLNYCLKCSQKKRAIKSKVATWLFKRGMKKWQGQNELSYFKKETPDNIVDYPTSIEKQWAVWHHLCSLGEKMIEAFISHILPQFDEIVDVQIRKEINNGEGDVLTVIADFKAKLKDGRIAVMDNKSASNPYSEDAVKESTQLPIYTEHMNTEWAGYIVFHKKWIDAEKSTQIIIDKIEESKLSSVYSEMSDIVGKIKAEVFPKNNKACFSYGKKCDYYLLCKYGNKKRLQSRK